MDVAALILAILAGICFFFTVRPPRTAPWLGVGLTLLTAAWICQCVHLTSTVVSAR